jgi:beta-glucosidase/6-phospho-beta-glucosidase/beta-galactosidase
MFSRTPGRVFEGHTGAVACDHYHRYAEDIGLMRDIGLPHYRLSVSWPRVLPNGTGAVNAKGLEFYDRLVDTLLAAGVQPWVTLFHWDFPYELYNRGGWLNPDSPQWFADYTRIIVDRLSDRVSRWMTLNEPQCFIGLGLQNGGHAPGDRLGLTESLFAPVITRSSPTVAPCRSSARARKLRRKSAGRPLAASPFRKTKTAPKMSPPLAPPCLPSGPALRSVGMPFRFGTTPGGRIQ